VTHSNLSALVDWKPAEASAVYSQYLAEEEVSVFESMRCYNGCIFQLERHLARLYESAKTAGVDVKLSSKELGRALKQAVKEYRIKEGFLRFAVNKRGSFLIMGNRTHPKSVFEKGIVLSTSPVRKSQPKALFAEIKSSNYMPGVMTYTDKDGGYEHLMLGQDGLVREALVSNLFMIKKDCCLTPPRYEILGGVTRGLILKMAAKIGLAVVESEFTRHDLFNADEVFLTNTSGELMPVREVDGRIIGAGRPGKWTRRMRVEFARIVNQYKKESRRG